MQRRNFFKNLIATVVGIFAVSSKPAKAQNQATRACNKQLQHILDWAMNNPELVKEAMEKPQTTLRFNENRIEAWNGESWITILIVHPEPTDPSDFVNNHVHLCLTIPSPTAEHRLNIRSREENRKELNRVIAEHQDPTKFKRKKGTIAEVNGGDVGAAVITGG